MFDADLQDLQTPGIARTLRNPDCGGWDRACGHRGACLSAAAPFRRPSLRPPWRGPWPCHCSGYLTRLALPRSPPLWIFARSTRLDGVTQPLGLSATRRGPMRRPSTDQGTGRDDHTQLRIRVSAVVWIARFMARSPPWLSRVSDDPAAAGRDRADAAKRRMRPRCGSGRGGRS